MAGPAAEFDHQTIAFADRGQQGEHSRRARVRMESETQVVDTCQIGPIARVISFTHLRSTFGFRRPPQDQPSIGADMKRPVDWTLHDGMCPRGGVLG